jgi:hypothetical protein
VMERRSSARAPNLAQKDAQCVRYGLVFAYPVKQKMKKNVLSVSALAFSFSVPVKVSVPCFFFGAKGSASACDIALSSCIV